MYSKTITFNFRTANRNIFEAIRNGRKTIETRAASPKFSGIKTGDVILLKCGRDKIYKKIKHVKIFPNTLALIKQYKIKDINPFCKTKSDLDKMYNSFEGYKEKIKRYGIIALEL